MMSILTWIRNKFLTKSRKPLEYDSLNKVQKYLEDTGFKDETKSKPISFIETLDSGWYSHMYKFRYIKDTGCYIYMILLGNAMDGCSNAIDMKITIADRSTCFWHKFTFAYTFNAIENLELSFETGIKLLERAKYEKFESS